MTADTTPIATEDVEYMPSEKFIIHTSDDMMPEWAKPLAIIAAIGYYILPFFVAVLIIVAVYKLIRLMKKKRELQKMIKELEENKDEQKDE